MALNKEEKIQLEENFKAICDEIVRDPEKLEEFANTWNSDFWNYSIRNLLLAKFQFPETSMLAGGRKWNQKGRMINKGARAIYIWAPNIYKNKETGENELHGFRLVPVFDVKQTNGDPLDEVGHTRLIPETEYKFKDFQKTTPYPVIIEDCGESNGQTDGEKIKITPKANETSMIATLFHEEAHIEFDHPNSNVPKSIREITAEAVSYIVCTFFGIKNEKAKYYIGNWEQHKDELKGHGWEVVQVAERIINRHKSAVMKS